MTNFSKILSFKKKNRSSENLMSMAKKLISCKEIARPVSERFHNSSMSGLCFFPAD